MIPTGREQIIPTYYYWPPKFFHLPASLNIDSIRYMVSELPFIAEGKKRKESELLVIRHTVVRF